MKFENYTAMDYYDKAFALDVSGKAKGAGETYEQAAMNVWRDIEQQYPLMDMDALEDLIGTTERTAEGYKAAIDFINKLAEKGEKVTTDDLAAVFDFHGLGDGEIARHIVLAKSGKMRSGSPARSARNKTVSHAQEILSKAILVEIQPTKHSDGPYKTTGRDAVHSYRFIIPVTFRGKPQVLVITAEGFNNDVLNKLNEVSLYEVYNRKIPLSEADIAGLSENGINEGNFPSAYTLAQLLSNVKDLHGKPYVIDGEVQFDKDIVLDMKNPALQSGSGKCADGCGKAPSGREGLEGDAERGLGGETGGNTDVSRHGNAAGFAARRRESASNLHGAKEAHAD